MQQRQRVSKSTSRFNLEWISANIVSIGTIVGIAIGKRFNINKALHVYTTSRNPQQFCGDDLVL